MMPKVIVCNSQSEAPPEVLRDPSLPLTRACWRALWYAVDGDVLISSVPFQDDFLSYVADILGIDGSSLSVIVRPGPITDGVLKTQDLVDELQGAVRGHHGWSIISSFFTPGVAELGSQLGIATYGGNDFAVQRGGDIFNRKSLFRQLAAGIDLPIPTGLVVQSPQELSDAIARLVGPTGTAIVKRDNGGGGLGNVTLTTGDALPLPGSRETLPLEDRLDAIAESLWSEFTDEQCRQVVVESYHDASQSFFLEYFVGASGIPNFLSSGSIRRSRDEGSDARSLVWTGLEIPADVSPFSIGLAQSEAMRFLMLAAQVGYRGYMNIDGVLTIDGRILFNEVNGRWGGSLVLHTIGERIFGRNYADEHVISSIRDSVLGAHVPLPDLLKVLDQNGLDFRLGTGEGVLVVAYDPALRSPLECLIVAAGRARAREIEIALRAAMKNIDAADMRQ